MVADPVDQVRGTARERIMATAYALFSRRGIRGVGIDEVIAKSSVAKATLYKHFPSKDELVLAFLARREQEWTRDFVEDRSRRDSPEESLLAVFEVFDTWFRTPSAFDGCSFINVLLEMGPDHPAGRASVHYLAGIRTIVRSRAEAAGLADPEAFAHSFHLLMKGSIIAAAEGDTEAAQRARAMAVDLIARHRGPSGAG
ncbi:TetR family transcriptional regulator [Murinocardiopsis flavida]|uniref:TetR family transcriptional regulator n=1 Tax=Murinocardiopsis flavida TaxID=645275 RepID=A0A2P8CXM4_9ACTN|nr:TetR/AcrR family transcriptional regulator [Murinocardiopsis flavida]PSK89666.1 TetR family transcriptional regulator [Murinocardiopsis flavida]